MISCVILTHNNQDSIEDALKSVSWCDETIVIDDESTDRTVAIAKQHKVSVFIRGLENNFAAQRNYGLEKAKGEWVLFLDSDEIVSPDLKKDIQEELKKQITAEGYYIPRVDRMFGRNLRYGETGQARFIRLAKKKAGKWTREVHETWDVQGEVKTFTHPLLHSPHPTIKIFLSQINRYTSINARVFYREGKRATCFAIITYPAVKFLYTYIIKLGFLDGTAGFIMAMMMSFHSFLTRAKLWQLQRSSI
ncbi:MAG: glycosyltransferase family 2 protein [Candidatus Gottesmanbacteria bacterium]